ncbi:MAG: acyltransferase [Cardiobacteriaceae bacterium]|nr:acyltransferase [Cardiobacteriaceae bacterium]
MQSQNLRYIARLDHLRFFAFILVFLFHFRGSNPAMDFHGNYSSLGDLARLWVEHGYSGVSLFLVLSGFLFSLITDGGRKPVPFRLFIYNRILRIFPLLIFFTFLILTVHRAESTPMDILRLLTLQLNTGHPWTGWAHSDAFPSGPIWTIGVEFQFYLVFPLIIGFIHHKGISWALLVILLMNVTRLLLIGDSSTDLYYHLYHSITSRLDQFIIGILVGIYYLRCLVRSYHPLIFLVAALLIFIAFTTRFSMPQKSWFSASISFSLEAILWGVVILLYLKFPFPNWKKLDMSLAWLGRLSFSLYLFHLPITQFMVKQFNIEYPTGIKTLLLKSVLIISISILYSSLTYYAIEKPFSAKRVKYT